MNDSKYTLVHRQSIPAARQKAPFAAHIRKTNPRGEGDYLGDVRDSKQGESSLPSDNDFHYTPPKPEVAQTATEIVERPEVATAATTIGVWDLGARVGFLPAVLEVMNEAQSKFVFLDVLSPIPAGIISQKERVISWLSKIQGELDEETKGQISNSVMADDFYARAEKIRRDTKVHYLVGITTGMIAGENEDGPYWDYISNCEKRLVLVSVFKMRTYAAKAKRPFEVAVAISIFGQLLEAVHPTKVQFHPNRGCLFDFNEKRYTAANVIRDPKIEDECAKKLPKSTREAAQAILQALRNYQRD